MLWVDRARQSLEQKITKKTKFLSDEPTSFVSFRARFQLVELPGRLPARSLQRGARVGSAEPEALVCFCL